MVDHFDENGNGVGGGEILDFFGIGSNKEYNFNSPFLNNALIRLYQLLPYIILALCIVIILIMIRIIMNMYNIKTLSHGRGISNELNYIDKLKKREASILRWNRFIKRTTNIVERSLLKSNKYNKEYVEYNLERACIKIPGGSRYFTAEEFNAVVVSISMAVILVSILVGVFANYIIGIVMIVVTIILASTIPMIYIRSIVKIKDEEIKSNFSDFYLMMHYVLLAGAKTPLVGIMKSYAKTTNSDEMIRLVDTCVHYMDTYGEYEGATYISKAYREIPVISKLMRLIRQANDGGDISQELMGFRAELLNDKRYAIERRTDKLIKRARASFNLLLPILFQAILSAMSIYFSDLGLIEMFTSGL